MRPLVKVLLALLFVAPALSPAKAGARPPNIVVILVDDMGYADTGAYGSPNLRTPNLDRMAAAGQRWTNFYSASHLCTPSRAGLLTGRLPIRSGTEGASKGHAVFFPFSRGGLPTGEMTLAELLKQQGYRTAAIGKWHLGHLPAFLPTRQGFESYYGIPYSNDMSATAHFLGWRQEIEAGAPDLKMWDVPLMLNEREIERPVDQFTLTRRYTERAVDFIREQAKSPFFLYLAHGMPHVPLFSSPQFSGRSAAGPYGDAIEELDWSVGKIQDALRSAGVEKNTLVIFTSDNGPWSIMRQHAGSADMLHDGKGTTWEGGMRVPGIFYWPGVIKPEVVHSVGSALDFLPTIAALTGAAPPQDRVIDGISLAEILKRGETGVRGARTLFYYRRGEVYAVRHGAFKAHFVTESNFQPDNQRQTHDRPLLFNLSVDPAERVDVASRHPDVVAQMVRLRDAQIASVEPVPNQLEQVDAREEATYLELNHWLRGGVLK
jgi:arylsulfatase A